MNILKKSSNEGNTAEDDIKNMQTEVQKLTDKYVDIVNSLCTTKENEITQI